MTVTDKKGQSFKQQNLHRPLLLQVTRAGGVPSSGAFECVSNSRSPAVQGPFVVSSLTLSGASCRIPPRLQRIFEDFLMNYGSRQIRERGTASYRTRFFSPARPERTSQDQLITPPPGCIPDA